MSEIRVPYVAIEILRDESYLIDKSTNKPGRGIILSTSGGEGKNMSAADIRDQAITRARDAKVAFAFRDLDHMANVLRAKEVLGSSTETQTEQAAAMEGVLFLADQSDPNRTLL